MKSYTEGVSDGLCSVIVSRPGGYIIPKHITSELPELPELPDYPKMGNVLTDDVRDAYIVNCKAGYIEEDYSVLFIKRYLLTPEQLLILSTEVLSIEDVLNGRFSLSDMNMIENEFFKKWNDVLGEKLFGA